MSKTKRTILLAVLSVLYIAGIIALFFNLPLGLTLWAAALIPSLIMYLYSKRKELLETEEKLEQEEQTDN